MQISAHKFAICTAKLKPGQTLLLLLPLPLPLLLLPLCYSSQAASLRALANASLWTSLRCCCFYSQLVIFALSHSCSYLYTLCVCLLNKYAQFTCLSGQARTKLLRCSPPISSIARFEIGGGRREEYYLHRLCVSLSLSLVHLPFAGRTKFFARSGQLVVEQNWKLYSNNNNNKWKTKPTTDFVIIIKQNIELEDFMFNNRICVQSLNHHHHQHQNNSKLFKFCQTQTLAQKQQVSHTSCIFPLFTVYLCEFARVSLCVRENSQNEPTKGAKNSILFYLQDRKSVV